MADVRLAERYKVLGVLASPHFVFLSIFLGIGQYPILRARRTPRGIGGLGNVQDRKLGSPNNQWRLHSFQTTFLSLDRSRDIDRDRRRE